MIQFFGLHIDRSAASAVVLGKDLSIWSRATTAVVNAMINLDEFVVLR